MRFLFTLLFVFFSLVQGKAQCNPGFSYSVNYAAVSFFPAFNTHNKIHTWYFGDGQVSHSYVPQHQYQLPGVYSVKHVVKDSSGSCKDSVTQNITLTFTAYCGVNILYSVDTMFTGSGKSYYFYSQTQPQPGSSYQWWIDGIPSATTFSNAAILMPGIHNVCLKITTPQCSDSACITINVPQWNACNTNPVFTKYNSGPSTLQWSFAVQNAIPHMVYKWKFNDGSIQYGSVVQKTFSSAGVKLAKLYAFFPSSSCIDSTEQAFNVLAPPPCNAAFTYTVSGAAVSFTPAVMTNGYGHVWRMGDGAIRTSKNPTHIYPSAGTYSVKHIIYDSIGNCIDSTAQQIAVSSPGTCSALFNWVRDTNQFNWYVVSSQATVSTGSVTSFGWSLDGVSQGNNNFFARFLSPGAHTICHYIVSSGGCVDTVCQTLWVPTAIACNWQASFTYQQTSTSNTLQFTAAPTGKGYFWNFGDGSSSTQANPLHTYNIAQGGTGSFYVRLRVFDSLAQCVDSIMQLVTVQAPVCTPAFTVQGSGSTRQLTMTQPVSGSQFWLIKKLYSPDSAVYITTTNPNHQFQDTGFYRICLTVSNAGCIGSVCDTIEVSSLVARPSETLLSYPNPAVGTVKINLPLESAGQVQIAVFNAYGNQVHVQLLAGQVGNNVLTIPILSLNGGQYFVRITANGQVRKSVFQKL